MDKHWGKDGGPEDGCRVRGGRPRHTGVEVWFRLHLLLWDSGQAACRSFPLWCWPLWAEKSLEPLLAVDLIFQKGKT